MTDYTGHPRLDRVFPVGTDLLGTRPSRPRGATINKNLKR